MTTGARIPPDGGSAPSDALPEHGLRARLRAALSASAASLRSPRAEHVIPGLLRVTRDLLQADGHAVWHRTRGTWALHCCEGVAEGFAREAGARWDGIYGALEDPTPRVVEDVRTAFTPDEASFYLAEGIRSILVLPLAAEHDVPALLVFYSRERRRFSSGDIEAAQALGNAAAVALGAGAAEDDQRRTREQASFLAQASAALADSLDLEVTLNTVARLAVPAMADSCAIHLIDDSGNIRLVAAVHVDPLKALAMRTLADPETSAPSRLWVRTIREGVPTLLANIDDHAVNQSLQGDGSLLRAFDEVRFTSQISVPLRARGRTIGGITFALGPGTRRYDTADLHLAEDLAQRAALAVDNARAYKQASDANRLKDEFLGTLSHELRTPLNAILGYARMLRGGILEDPAKRARAVEILERNAQSLTQIVEDVLDVSRIIAGKLRLEMQETHLAGVVDDAVATILPTAEAKGVCVRTTVERDTPSVWGDPERLQQVVWNLLVNAVKFTPAGGAVHVQLRQDGRNAEVTVADTGQGIAADFLPHLFERFRQADSRFARQHGGLGLGLAIAREIAQSHGGSIHAASDGVGRGATFTVRLPLLPARATADAGTAERRPEPLLAIREALRGLRVLVVDDDDDARGLVQTIVEEAGGQAITADCAKNALRVLDAMMPDVMVTDLGMPGMDGLELIRTVRGRADGARAVPAIALTAYARSEDRLTALRSGFQRHLAKPVDHVQLVATIVALAAETRTPL